MTIPSGGRRPASSSTNGAYAAANSAIASASARECCDRMPDADIRPPREWLVGRRIGAAWIRPIVTHGPSAMHPCQADVRTRIGSMSQTEIASAVGRRQHPGASPRGVKLLSRRHTRRRAPADTWQAPKTDER
jgi:hypothetical protein